MNSTDFGSSGSARFADESFGGNSIPVHTIERPLMNILRTALYVFASDKGMTSLLRVDYNQPFSNISEAENYLKDIASSELKLAVRLPLLADTPETEPFDRNRIEMIFATGKLIDEANSAVWTTEISIDEGEDTEALYDILEKYPDIPRVNLDQYCTDRSQDIYSITHILGNSDYEKI